MKIILIVCIKICLANCSPDKNVVVKSCYAISVAIVFFKWQWPPKVMYVIHQGIACLWPFLVYVQTSVRPKPGFGIGNRNQGPISVLEPKLFFFPKPKHIFFSKIFKFSYVFLLLGGYKFLKAWNWTQIFKNNLKIFIIWQQIWFLGALWVLW